MHECKTTVIPLPAGHTMMLAAGSHWRVSAGAVMTMLSEVTATEDGHPVLALPGDLLGLGTLAGGQSPKSVVALVDSELKGVDHRDTPLQDLLAQGLLQAQRHYASLIRLRTGPVSERLRQLLLMLTRPSAEMAPLSTETPNLKLPPLRASALLVDAAPETVCRVFASLRKLDILKPQQAPSAEDPSHALRALKIMPGMSSSVPAHRPDRRCAGHHAPSSAL